MNNNPFGVLMATCHYVNQQYRDLNKMLEGRLRVDQQTCTMIEHAHQTIVRQLVRDDVLPDSCLLGLQIKVDYNLLMNGILSVQVTYNDGMSTSFDNFVFENMMKYRHSSISASRQINTPTFFIEDEVRQIVAIETLKEREAVLAEIKAKSDPLELLRQQVMGFNLL